MALTRNLLVELLALYQTGQLGCIETVIEIGAQQLSRSFLNADAEQTALFNALTRRRPSLGDAAESTFALESSAPSSIAFWEALGAEVKQIDFTGAGGAAALDLNRDMAPRRWRKKFDLVVNAGTTEHILNQDNVFRVIHDLVRVGGLMFHEVPVLGMPTHGVVSYGLPFFWHLCRANAYEVLCLDLVAGQKAPMTPSIVESIGQYGRCLADPSLLQEGMREWCAVVTLRKVTDGDFVTPLDLPPEPARAVRMPSLPRAAGALGATLRETRKLMRRGLRSRAP